MVEVISKNGAGILDRRYTPAILNDDHAGSWPGGLALRFESGKCLPTKGSTRDRCYVMKRFLGGIALSGLMVLSTLDASRAAGIVPRMGFGSRASPPRLVERPGPTIFPTSFKVGAGITGRVQMFSLIGAPPATGTWRIDGAGASLFSMDARTGALSIPAAINPGVYTFNAKFADGPETLTQSVVVTVVRPAEEVFATPSESEFPGPSITLDLNYKVTASTVPRIAVNTQFEDLRAAYDAATATAPATIRLSAGTYSIDTVRKVMLMEHHGAAIVGHCCGADLDGDGVPDPDTKLIPTAQQDLFFIRSPYPDTFWIKNIVCGPDDDQPRAGGACLHFVRGGNVNLISVIARNLRGSGSVPAAIFGASTETWENLRSGAIRIYDSEIYNSNAADLGHQTYILDSSQWFIRSISRDPAFGHALKAEGEKFIVLDSYIAKGTGATAAVIDSVVSTDNRYGRNLVKLTTAKPPAPLLFFGFRNDSGFSLETKPWSDVEKLSGVVHACCGKVLVHWRDGGNYSTHFLGSLQNVDFPVGSTAVTVRANTLDPDGTKGPRRALDTTKPYTVRIYLSDGSIYEGTSTSVSLNVDTTGAACMGCTTFKLDTPLRAQANKFARIAIKLASARWDVPILNSHYYNKSDPDYWWNELKDANGNLDYAKQANYNTTYVEDNLLVLDTSYAGVNAGPISGETTSPQTYFSIDGVDEVPLPPLNNPLGASTAWPDVAGAGTWLAPLASPNYPSRGINPAVSDWLWPWGEFFADNGIVALNRPFTAQFGNGLGVRYPVPAVPPAFRGVNHEFRYLDTSGAVQLITGNRSPLTQGYTTLAANAPGGSQAITVAAGTNCQQGWKLIVELPMQRGASRALQISTIDQPPTTTSIHMADGMVRAGVSGAVVSCFPKAGPRPAWWVSPMQYSVK
jgi:hypothetical protein